MSGDGRSRTPGEADAPATGTGREADDATRAVDADEARASRWFHALVAHAPWGLHVWRVEADDRLFLVAANRAADELLNTDHDALIGLEATAVLGGLADPGVLSRVPETLRGPGRTTLTAVHYVTPQVEHWFTVEMLALDDRHVSATFVDETDHMTRVEGLARHADLLGRLAVRLTEDEERDRRRIANDLHDYVGQELAAAKLRLAHAVDSLRSGDETGFEVIGEVVDVLERTMDVTRAATRDLAPPVLYELGIEHALDSLRDTFEHRFGLRTAYHAEVPPGSWIPGPTQSFLYRAARELLTNVVLHSGADSASMSLEQRPNVLLLRVRDEGIGCPWDTMSTTEMPDSYGLVNVQNMARTLGGRLEVRSDPGAGFTATVMLPPHVGVD